jgi:hypothetical protein
MSCRPRGGQNDKRHCVAKNNVFGDRVVQTQSLGTDCQRRTGAGSHPRGVRLFALSAVAAVGIVLTYLFGVYCLEASHLAKRRPHPRISAVGLIWRDVANSWPLDIAPRSENSLSVAARSIQDDASEPQSR